MDQVRSTRTDLPPALIRGCPWLDCARKYLVLRTKYRDRHVGHADSGPYVKDASAPWRCRSMGPGTWYFVPGTAVAVRQDAHASGRNVFFEIREIERLLQHRAAESAPDPWGA